LVALAQKLSEIEPYTYRMPPFRSNRGIYPLSLAYRAIITYNQPSVISILSIGRVLCRKIPDGSGKKMFIITFVDFRRLPPLPNFDKRCSASSFINSRYHDLYNQPTKQKDEESDSVSVLPFFRSVDRLLILWRWQGKSAPITQCSEVSENSSDSRSQQSTK